MISWLDLVSGLVIIITNHLVCSVYLHDSCLTYDWFNNIACLFMPDQFVGLVSVLFIHHGPGLNLVFTGESFRFEGIYEMMCVCVCVFPNFFFHHMNMGGSKKSDGNFDVVGFWDAGLLFQCHWNSWTASTLGFWERVVLSEGCQFHCRLVASIDKGNRVIRTEYEKKTQNIWRTLSKGLENSKVSTTRWWFQSFFIFTPTWGNDPIWLIVFR